MKKAFDQTVRDLKREVNKKVLKVPGIEQKVLDATSNEVWGPHGSLLSDIAQATRNYHEYQLIMSVLWKRINDTGKNWRHVYKALIVLDYLVAHGSERVIDEIREHSYQIQTLADFQYIDSSGRDQGSNVRRKSQSLVALVNDKERIHEARQKAYANRDKFQGPSSTGGMHRPSSYSSSGGYGDRNDDDRYGGRYGSRDDDRNGYGRERDWGNRDDGYGRGGDSYYRDGDRYSNRDSDDRNSRDSYRDDEYRSKRTPDDYQYGRNRSFGSDKDRPSEDERNPPRQIERKPSEQSIGAPPTYEEALGVAHNQSQGESGKNSGMSQNEPTVISAQGDSMLAQSQGQPPSFAAEASYNTSSEIDTFDEFDPRGQISDAPTLATNTDMNIISSLSDSLALVPVEAALDSDANAHANSGNGTTFVSMTAASSILNQPTENPFGDSPFKVTSSVSNFSSPPETSLPTSSLHSTTSVEFFGDGLQGINYASSFNTSSVQLPSSSITETSQSQFLVPNQSNDILAGLLPPTGPVGSIQTPPVLSGYGAPVNPQSVMPGYHFPMGGSQTGSSASAFPTQLAVSMVTVPVASQQSPFGLSSLPQVDPPATTVQVPSQSTPSAALTAPIISNLAPTSSGPLSVNTQPQPTKEKFETKSTVWTDTLNRGLVDLNISGPKINPLADIGIDFDSINRKEKRKEKSTTVPATSTTTMGKAMGSGSGVGRAGASVLITPRVPMTAPNMGMGMNGGAGMMGPGMAGNINMMGLGMGMGMGTYAGVHPPGMGQGMQMPPAPTGMQGGYYPMMGMGTYAPQQPYGGYR